MPRPEFGTAPFIPGNAASSAVISGAAKADAGMAMRVARNAARIILADIFNIEMLAHLFARYGSDLQGSTPTSVADDGVRRPEQRMRVGELGIPRLVEKALAVHQRDHGAAQRFAARQLGIVGLALEQVGDQV